MNSPSAKVVLVGSAARGTGFSAAASQPAWNSLTASGPRWFVPSSRVEKASSPRSCSPIASASLWYQFPIVQTGADAGTRIW